MTVTWKTRETKVNSDNEIYSCVSHVYSYCQEKLVRPREKEEEKSPEVWTDSENARSELDLSQVYIQVH